MFNDYVESRSDFFSKADVICDTLPSMDWKKQLKNSNIKDFISYFNESGNLAAASFPWILAEKYGNNIPENKHFCCLGKAAGGSESIVTFI